MKLIVIDNYDSFTYNLVHYFEDLGCDVTVKRNDEVEMSEIEKFEYLVLSPCGDTNNLESFKLKCAQAAQIGVEYLICPWACFIF